MIYTPFVWLPLFSAVLLAGIAVYAGRFRGVRGNGPFRALMWLCALFAVLLALSLLSNVPQVRFFLAQVIYLPAAFVAPAILLLAVEYTGHGRWLTRRRLVALMLVPTITVIAALSYPFHQLFRYDFQLVRSDPLPTVSAERGPWYWVYYTYGSALTVGACGILIASLRSRHLWARNTLLILLGVLIPMLADVLTVLRVTPLPGQIWTTLMFVCTGVLYGWALLRGQLFNVRPMARDSLMEHLGDPVIVLDAQGCIVDFNRSARDVCALAPAVLGKELAAMPPAWALALGGYGDMPEIKDREVAVGDGAQQRVYDLSIVTVQDRRRSLGRLLILHDVTARKRAEMDLRESEERFRQMVDVSPVPLALTRVSDNTYIYVNAPAAALIGLPQAAAIGRRSSDFYADPSVRPAIVAEILQTGKVRNCEVLLRRVDGSTFWGLFSAALTHFSHERAILAGITDISERKQMEAALRESERRHRMLAENMHDVIWTLDVESLRFIYMSPSVERLRGFTAEEVLCGSAYDSLMPEAGPGIIRMFQSRVKQLLAGPGQRSYCDEIEQPCKDGSSVWTEVVTTLFLVAETGKVEVYGVTRDISERKKAQDALRWANQQLRAQLEANQQLQARLREQADQDALTGLFNRRYLEEVLERVLARASLDHTPVSILMLDVDHFKQFNDSYGHKAGDLVLRALGQLLRAQTRPVDVACRFGGEEFIVLLPGAPLDTAFSRANELRGAFADLRVHYGGVSLSATVTIGVATFPDHGADSGQLLRAVDQALYAAKAAGRDTVCTAA